MTFGEFKSAVAGYMNREVSVFVSNGVDTLTSAINQAKRWAERQHNFELCRMSAKLAGFTYQNGGSFSAITDMSGTSISVKCIERAFPNGVPVDVISRWNHQNRIKRMYAEGDPGETRSSKLELVQHGDLLYLAPIELSATSAFDLKMDVVRWLPRYVADTDTDFLLDFCEDFMMFRSVYQLNFLVKEDNRVDVSAKALSDSWESVLRWDNNIIIGSNDDGTLD